MDMNLLTATQGYARALAVAQPDPDSAEAGFARLTGSFAETLAAGERTAKAVMTGGADPHALVQALSESQLAIETVVTVRDRVVEAYQEILRMPV
jgi:flagellar hook-basal body complex protein FliE